ncbi:MAG: hypothetical protein KQH67_01115 [Bacteroidetes bacterium]|nr:hypothetical protein [Bacteroidota bacterium]
MNRLKKISFVFLIMVMVFPALQKELQMVHVTELNGDFIENEMPRFTWQSFYNGSFQSAFEAYLEQHIGFHNILVRLKNQLDYSLFKKPNAEGIVIGKNNFIFEYDYIREITGRAYVGYDFIDEKLRRLQYVQQYLKSNYNTDFVIVFIPGKASFYKEYIPAKYFRNVQDSTNYTVYLYEIKHRGIQYINLNEYFLQIKESAEHPIFPKYGTHWSIYGMSRASHVLIDSMEQIKNKKLNDYNTDSLYFSSTPLRTDYDGGKALNLLLNLSDEIYAYPEYYFGQDSSRYKPKVLTIGDSFYWNIFNAGIPKNLFANEAFWYYNSKVYPDYYNNPIYTSEYDLKKEVQQMDFVFIMVTERFLNVFDWKFIDQLYYLLTPDYIKDPIYDYMNSIVLDASWFNVVLHGAKAKGISNQQSLYLNAEYMHRLNAPEDYMLRYGLDAYKDQIKSQRLTMSHLQEKSETEGRLMEEMIQEEATNRFSKQYPDVYKDFIRINEKKQQIMQDPGLLDSVRSLADKYYSKLDDMIFFQAKEMMEEKDIQLQIEKIMADEEWVKSIKEKAKDKNISFEEMLRADAIYMLNENK